MNTASNNVARLKTNNVYSSIRTFLRSKGLSSANTEREYEADIRQFFKFIRNKEIEELVEADLHVVKSDILDYQVYLSEEKDYQNTTVNRKINTLRSLYEHLKGDDYDVNPYVMKIKDLPDDTKHIGFLSPDEAWLLADLALKTERENAKMKYALILTAASTSLRKTAILNLCYSDIYPTNEEDKYVIRCEDKDRMDKGKTIEKQIHKDLYQLLLDIKDTKYNDDKIFHIDNMIISKMMKRLCEKAGLDPRRNISFHSLKKAGVRYADETSGGDIKAIVAQGGWSSPAVYLKHYAEKPMNIAGMGMFEKTDPDIFKQLTHEECVQLLESVGNGLGQQLRRTARKMIEERQ